MEDDYKPVVLLSEHPIIDPCTLTKGAKKRSPLTPIALVLLALSLLLVGVLWGGQ